MWIRSQSKETLLKATKIFIHDNQVFASMEDGFDEMVGEYKSKERALEVLDEIQTEISNYVGTMAQIVYEMPKEWLNEKEEIQNNKE